MRLFRRMCIAVVVASIAGLALTEPPVQSWSAVTLFVALVAWALASAGRFFLAEGERGARIAPERVTRARWLERPTRALALTLWDGTTTVVDDPDVALAMAVTLARRGLEVEGTDPGAPPPHGGGGFVGPTGKLERR